MVTKNMRTDVIVYLLKKDHISVVGLSYTLQRGEAKKLRKLAESSSEYEAVCLVDSRGGNPKFWYKRDQIDAMLRQIRTGTPPAQGELFSGVDMGSPEGDKTVETTINTQPEEASTPVEETAKVEPEIVS